MSRWLKIVLSVVLLAVIFAAGIFTSRLLWPSTTTPSSVSAKPVDKNVAFVAEVYQTIQSNYWNKLTDTDLNKIFVAAAEKITNLPQSGKFTSRTDVTAMVASILAKYTDDNKKHQFVTTLADVVASNLEPAGRSRLYTQKETTSLDNTVQNRDPTANRYQDLGVATDASASAIASAYSQKTRQLESRSATDAAAKKELLQVKEAYKVLADPASRQVYDLSGAEPTIDYKLLTSQTYYVHLTKFSPTTFDEMIRVFDKAKDFKDRQNLILDLRDNIGGAIDYLPYFMGPFVGNDQYAYQFFHQGDKVDFKTKTGWLESLLPYKKVVVLINGNTQSTAEVMAATLKKYNVGVLVGTTTRGWGTVEKVYPLTTNLADQNNYSLLLVHSLTLKEDGTPIEGHGVSPLVDSSITGWQSNLLKYFSDKNFVDTVNQVLFGQI